MSLEYTATSHNHTLKCVISLVCTDQSAWRTITNPGRYPNRDEVSQTGCILTSARRAMSDSILQSVRQQQGRWQKRLGSKCFTWQIAAWRRDQNVGDRKLGYSILVRKNHGKNSALGAAKGINSRNDCEEEVLWSKSHHEQGLPKNPMLKHAAATKGLISSKEQNRSWNKNQEGKSVTKLKSKAAHVTSTSRQKL